MSEQDSRPPFLFYLVTGVVVTVVLGAAGVLLHLNWEKLGLPNPGEFVLEVQEAHTGEVEGAAVVEGNAANYLKYVNREDVFVVVNHYLPYDELADKLKLDLKRLSARHEGRVLIMNVDAQRQARLSVDMRTDAPRELRLMLAGKELKRFGGEDLIWDLDAYVSTHREALVDPVEQAAAETSPYGESLRTGGGQALPEGITPN